METENRHKGKISKLVRALTMRQKIFYSQKEMGSFKRWRRTINGNEAEYVKDLTISSKQSQKGKWCWGLRGRRIEGGRQ